MGELGVPAIQLIDEKGNFNEDSLVRFSKEVRLSECGLSYAVVAIMGPQSSGKSTLLNHLLGTRFREMNALEGRNQTTKGVWLQRAEGVTPCSLVMDLEGTDGRERGEDDTAFEKQSALFSLAVADVVLINLWCHDIGREQASNKPMLKTVFQVMTRLFSPRKTTLMFVLRDKTKTPMKILERILRNDVERIWDGIPKEKEMPLTEFFNVEVTALSNYEENEERFMEEVRQLKERFQNSVAPGGLAGDRRAVVPGSGFPFSAHEIWKVIKENKDLDLPAHKVMVATVRCDEIAHEKLQSLAKDEEWKKLEKDCRVAEFGKKVSEVLKRYTSEYDAEAGFFDERVRTAKRSFLVSEALEMMSPAYDAVVAHHRAAALDRFRDGLQAAADSEDQEFTAKVRHFKIQALRSFDQACADASVPQAAEAWNPSKAREKLTRGMDAHAQSLRAERIQALKSKWERRLEDGIGEPVAALLDAGPPDAWASIRELVASEIEKATTGLATELKGYEPTREEEGGILKSLPKHSRAVVEGKDREATSQALIRMKDRFHNLFGHDEESLPRVWGEEHNIRAITKTARVGVLKMLAIIAALRLKTEEDGIEDALLSLVNDSEEPSNPSNALASSTWPGVAPEDTMLTPTECRRLWRPFRAETEYTISQALSAQEAKMRRNSRLPPPWAVAAMVILGFNEFMALLRNPIYLMCVFVAFLLVRAVWVQLDLDRHFQYGVMPGLVSVSSKYLPAVVEAFQGVVDAGTTPPQPTEANNNRRNEGKLAYD